ncbi:MAG: hypothetical protein A2X59_07180 [Nitrospirae bacterium GWC2_42_7]|nr:MAG: hypothetical protein A2X59_07180 [Nitrospirae bacterium GWC2_42_7]
MNKDMQAIFENIKTQYGDVASWAVWKTPSGNNFASNMEVDGLFDLDTNPNILDQLNNNIIMVGYNFSIPLDNPPKFHNFHTYNGANINHTTLRNASKIRYAFSNTPYGGAYMTDIIKNYVESKSEKVAPSNLDADFATFRKELETLQADKPVIIAFGSIVYALLKEHLKPNDCSELIRVTHYSHYGDGCATHEGYRRKVFNQLKIA